MAATPIELALSTLLPTIAFLPPELIHLATSLLAQSRSKAASLKPEEEIGRSYACAHIACERLARQLDLEIGDARPPVKPKVYAKLRGYLDGVLVAERGGGGGRRTSTMEDTLPKAATQAATPVREARTSTSVVKESFPIDDSTTTEEKEVPAFVMPLIRAICKSCHKPAAVPHIHVGAQAVVREIVSRNVKRAQEEPASKRRRRTPQSAKRVERSPAPVVTAAEAVSQAKWPALLVALSVFTAARMEGVDVEASALIRERAVGAVRSFCEDGRRVLPNDVRAMEGLEGNIKFYMLEAEDCGWLEMEWFRNIPEEEEDNGERSESDGHGRISEDEGPVTPRRRPAQTPLRRKEKHGGKRPDRLLGEEVGAAGLFPGLGTMFQPAIDWLSDENRVEFAQWKKHMLAEIAAVDQTA